MGAAGAQGPSGPFPNDIHSLSGVQGARQRMPTNFYYGAAGGPGAEVSFRGQKMKSNLFNVRPTGELVPIIPTLVGTNQIIDVGQGELNQAIPQAIRQNRTQESFVLRINEPSAPNAQEKQTVDAPVISTVPNAQESAVKASLNKSGPQVRQRRAKGKTILGEQLGGDTILGG